MANEQEHGGESLEQIAKQGFQQLNQQIATLTQIEQDAKRIEEQAEATRKRYEDQQRVQSRLASQGLNANGSRMLTPQQQMQAQMQATAQKHAAQQQFAAGMARNGMNPDGSRMLSPAEKMQSDIAKRQQTQMQNERVKQEMAARGMNPDGTRKLSAHEQMQAKVAQTTQGHAQAEHFKQEMARRGLNADGSRRLSPQEEMRNRIGQLRQGHAQSEHFAKELRSQGLNANGSKMTIGERIGGSKMGGAAMVATQAFTMAMQAGTPIVNAYNNAMMTGAQKMQNMAESIPVIGGIIAQMREFGDAIGGTTEKLRVNQVYVEQQTSMQARAHSVRLQTASAGMELFGAQSRATALGGKIPNMINRGDRSTVSGMHQYEYASAVQGPKDAAMMAGRQADAAGNTAEEAARQANALGEKQNELLTRRAVLQASINKALNDNTDRSKQKSQLDTLFGQQELNNQRIAQTSLELTTAKNRALQTGVEYAQKQHQATQANLAVQQAELGVLKQREQVATSNAQRLGMMNKVDRDIALGAAQMAKTQDWDSMPDDLKAAMNRAMPQETAKLAEQAGQRAVNSDARYGQYSEFRDTGDLKGIRSQVDTASANVRANLIFNDQELAKQIAAIIGPLFKDIKLELERTIADTRAATENRQRKGVNLSGG